jgi:hypothetical protein
MNLRILALNTTAGEVFLWNGSGEGEGERAEGVGIAQLGLEHNSC